MIAVVIQVVCVALIVIYYNKTSKIVQEAKKLQAENKTGYTAKCRLNELCWVRALERLKVIREDPEVTEVAMVLGTREGGGHAWIEYKRGDSVIQYDPTTEKIVEIT